MSVCTHKMVKTLSSAQRAFALVRTITTGLAIPITFRMGYILILCERIVVVIVREILFLKDSNQRL